MNISRLTISIKTLTKAMRGSTDHHNHMFALHLARLFLKIQRAEGLATGVAVQMSE